MRSRFRLRSIFGKASLATIALVASFGVVGLGTPVYLLWQAPGGATNVHVNAPLTGQTFFTGTVRSVTCSGDITSALGTAVSNSVTTDVVSIGAGSCSMSPLSLIQNKDIWIHGAGQGNTNITANTGFGGFESTGSDAPRWMLSDMSLSGSCAPCVVLIQWANQSATWRGPFRIHHVTMNYPNNGADGMLAFYGPVYGIIDHNDFTMEREAFILTALGVDSESPLGGAYAVSLAFRPGAKDYLYVEDNTFHGSVSVGASAIDTGYTGGRVVMRHNTTSCSNLYAHWTSGGSVNTLWWEIYNNKFDNTGCTTTYTVGRIQGGGTGLFYNNTIVGYTDLQIGEGRREGQASGMAACDGVKDWDGNAGDASAAGWPCLAQVGRDGGFTIAQIQSGSKQPSFPLYLWNNGPQDKCYNSAAGGSACDNSITVDPNDALYFKSTGHTVSGGGYGQGDVDWSKTASQPSGAGTHTLTYTPATYPHPCVTNFNPTTCAS